MSNASAIPVIDLHDALAPGAPRSADVATQLREAAMASGFFYVRHHGVPAALLARQFDIDRRLLDVPPATRERLAAHRSRTMRGYELMGSQTLDQEARPDLKESFYCGMAYPDDHPHVLAGHPSYGGNQWPPEVPEAPPSSARTTWLWR